MWQAENLALEALQPVAQEQESFGHLSWLEPRGQVHRQEQSNHRERDGLLWSKKLSLGLSNTISRKEGKKPENLTLNRQAASPGTYYGLI